MEIEIEYANTCCGRDTNSMIGYVANRTLASGTSSIYISGLLGRREHIKDQFGWSNTEFYALPPSLRYFFYDIGKSGSSGAADSVSASNPKYASGTSKALCSETVSWYYHEHGVSFRDHLFPWLTYDFEDITSHSVIHDHFKKGDRLYCYHFGRDQWIKRDRFYNWVYRDTYQPQAGDYLDRRPSDPTDGDDGHAMVVITWDDESNIVETIDGPYNINIRPVDIRAEEDDGTDYCVGRIPFND